MDRREWTTTGATSVLVFLVLFAGLTALREWNVEPSTGTQTGAVNAAVVLTVIGVALYVYRGGSLGGGWVLAFGPSLAFTANLLVPLSPMGVPAKVVYAPAGAAVISAALGVVGASVGTVGRTVVGRRGQRTDH
jgi:exosortase/archaeosortase